MSQGAAGGGGTRELFQDAVEAAKRGDAGLLESIAGGPHPAVLSMRTEQGDSLAHFAAAEGQVGVLRFLHRNVPDSLTAVDSHGCTPAHSAACTDQVDVLVYLAGQVPGQLSMRDEKSLLPLHYTDHLACREFIAGAVRAEKRFLPLLGPNGNISASPLRYKFVQMIDKVAAKVRKHEQERLNQSEPVYAAPRSSASFMAPQDSFRRERSAPPLQHSPFMAFDSPSPNPARVVGSGGTPPEQGPASIALAQGDGTPARSNQEDGAGRAGEAPTPEPCSNAEAHTSRHDSPPVHKAEPQAPVNQAALESPPAQAGRPNLDASAASSNQPTSLRHGSHSPMLSSAPGSAAAEGREEPGQSPLVARHESSPSPFLVRKGSRLAKQPSIPSPIPVKVGSSEERGIVRQEPSFSPAPSLSKGAGLDPRTRSSFPASDPKPPATASDARAASRPPAGASDPAAPAPASGARAQSLLAMGSARGQAPEASGRESPARSVVRAHSPRGRDDAAAAEGVPRAGGAELLQAMHAPQVHQKQDRSAWAHATVCVLSVVWTLASVLQYQSTRSPGGSPSTPLHALSLHLCAGFVLALFMALRYLLQRAPGATPPHAALQKPRSVVGPVGVGEPGRPAAPGEQAGVLLLWAILCASALLEIAQIFLLVERLAGLWGVAQGVCTVSAAGCVWWLSSGRQGRDRARDSVRAMPRGAGIPGWGPFKSFLAASMSIEGRVRDDMGAAQGHLGHYALVWGLVLVAAVLEIAQTAGLINRIASVWAVLYVCAVFYAVGRFFLQKAAMAERQASTAERARDLAPSSMGDLRGHAQTDGSGGNTGGKLVQPTGNGTSPAPNGALQRDYQVARIEPSPPKPQEKGAQGARNSAFTGPLLRTPSSVELQERRQSARNVVLVVWGLLFAASCAWAGQVALLLWEFQFAPGGVRFLRISS